MGLLSLLQNHPLLFAALAVVLLYSIILHEMAHGWTALLWGDDTALRHGRLTLNPLPHIDPLGLALLLAVGFGWAKPVPVDYGNLKNSRAVHALVALAGPATNILIAVVAIFILQWQGSVHPALSLLLQITVKINIVLAAFNLIPLPPLDGSKVVLEFLPVGIRRRIFNVERFGLVILAVLLFSGALNPVINFMEK